MTDYLTFISKNNRWMLYKGIGNTGTLIAEREAHFLAIGMSAAVEPWLWLCGQSPDGQNMIQRFTLPDLREEIIDWTGSRPGDIASSSDGERAVVLELPEPSSNTAGFFLWSDHNWTPLGLEMAPDVSSKVVWLDDHRIAYESGERRLVVADINEGTVQSGPHGRFPVVAATRNEWYACIDKSVVAFPVNEPFFSTPKTVDGFNFGTVTSLRVTHDGNVCTWTEPRFLYRSKTFTQARGQRKVRFRQLDDGLGAVIGPYSL